METCPTGSLEWVYCLLTISHLCSSVCHWSASQLWRHGSGLEYNMINKSVMPSCNRNQHPHMFISHKHYVDKTPFETYDIITVIHFHSTVIKSCCFLTRKLTSTTQSCSGPILTQKSRANSVPGALFSHLMLEMEFYYFHRLVGK